MSGAAITVTVFASWPWPMVWPGRAWQLWDNDRMCEGSCESSNAVAGGSLPAQKWVSSYPYGELEGLGNPWPLGVAANAISTRPRRPKHSA